MMNKLKLTCLGLACAFTLTGCLGGSSDNLGTVKDNQKALRIAGDVLVHDRDVLKKDKDSRSADINASLMRGVKRMAAEEVKEKIID